MIFRFIGGAGAIESLITNHQSRLVRGAIAGLVLCAAFAGDLSAAGFTFGALGDLPYSADEEERFPDLIAEMGREDLAFIVHVGDLKRATETCSDEIYLERRGWFEQSRHPFVFVPGDNEWTDCRRPFGAARDPLERMDKLRDLFFSGEMSLGQRKLRLERQPRPAGGSRYPEHSRWEHQGILFLTLNAPGPDNYTQAVAEFSARDRAVRLWLTESFASARARGLRGLAVFLHADMWSADGQPRRGFAGLLETLTAETRNFDGEVLLVNGDSHRYRVDRPLRDAAGAPLGNFLRVMVFGSPSLRWVRIRVSEEAGRVRFSAEPGD